MTPNFAEQAKAWRHKQTMTAGEDYIANLAFLAGCEHGYRVGKAERNCSVELTCEGGIFECQKEQIEKERDQLKARLAERDKMIAIMSDIGHKKHLENRRKFEELRTRIEDAESALGFIRVTIRRMGYDNKPPGPLGDFCQSIDAYFTKHPQDGANGGA